MTALHHPVTGEELFDRTRTWTTEMLNIGALGILGHDIHFGITEHYHTRRSAGVGECATVKLTLRVSDDSTGQSVETDITPDQIRDLALALTRVHVNTQHLTWVPETGWCEICGEPGGHKTTLGKICQPCLDPTGIAWTDNG